MLIFWVKKFVGANFTRFCKYAVYEIWVLVVDFAVDFFGGFLWWWWWGVMQLQRERVAVAGSGRAVAHLWQQATNPLLVGAR